MRSDEANVALATPLKVADAGPALVLWAAGGHSSEFSISEEEFVALTVRFERRVRLFIAMPHTQNVTK
jgi:hypothetical protein